MKKNTKTKLKELATNEPDMEKLLSDFRYVVNMRESSLFRRRRLNYDTRYCLWRNQCEDGRKWRGDITAANPKGEPFPWPGASDARVRLTELYINQDVAVGMVAWRRQRTVVSGTEINDAAQANRVTQILRWMKYTQMKESQDEHEFLLNTLFENGSAVMKTCWWREYQIGEDTLDLETLQGFAMQTFAAGQAGVDLSGEEQTLLDLPANVLDPTREKLAVEGLAVLYPDVQTDRLRQLVRDIRTQGSGPLPRPYLVNDRPLVRALVPNQDIFTDPEATDINEADNYEREVLREWQLRGRVKSHGWDAAWVEQMLASQRGRMTLDSTGNWLRQPGGSVWLPLHTERLYEVIHAYRRRADEDGVASIQYTVFSPGLPKDYGFHALLPYDHGEQPFTFFGTERKGRLLDDPRGYGEVTSTWQGQIKVEWDSRIDRAAIATLPPSHYPPGEAPSEWGPGCQIPTDRPDAYGFLEAPRYDIGSREVEQSVREFADEFLGRSHPEKNNIYAEAIRQQRIDRFLAGDAKVDAQTLALMQQYMQDEFFYRIVGDAKAKPLKATREEIQGKFDLAVTFNAANLDAERRAETISLLQEAVQMDTTGRLDRDETMTVLFELIDPGLGERVLRAPQDASQAEIDDEDLAFAKMFAGLQVDIRPGQAYQLRLQRLQTIMQTNPLAQQRYQQDEAFKEAVDRRVEQLTFQMQQQQNAVTGRFLGTKTQAAEQLTQGAAPQAPQIQQ